MTLLNLTNEQAISNEYNLWQSKKPLVNKILIEYDNELFNMTPQQRLILIKRVMHRAFYKPSNVKNPNRSNTNRSKQFNFSSVSKECYIQSLENEAKALIQDRKDSNNTGNFITISRHNTERNEITRLYNDVFFSNDVKATLERIRETHPNLFPYVRCRYENNRLDNINPVKLSPTPPPTTGNNQQQPPTTGNNQQQPPTKETKHLSDRRYIEEIRANCKVSGLSDKRILELRQILNVKL